MAFQRISLSSEQLLEAFQAAAKPLLYQSETDAPIDVIFLGADVVGEAFSPEDIQRLFYSAEDQFRADNVEWAEANRLESNGTLAFFRDSANVITTYPNNEYYVHETYHREHAPHWRTLRDLFFDHLVRQRYFRAELADPDQARADIYLVGRQLHIEVDPETNEMNTMELDWFVLKTYVIET